MTHPVDAPSRAEKLALGAILALAAALRLAGVAFGVSWEGGWVGVWHPDEVTLVVGNLWPDLNPHYHFYPSFHIYLLFLFDALLFWTAKLLGYAAHLDYRSFMDAATSPALGAQFVLHRLVSVAFALGTVALVWKAARDWWGWKAGLLAALLLAVAPLHVQESHYATVDASFTFFSLLTIHLAWRIARFGGRGDYLGAAFALAAVASIKYNGAAAVLAVLAGHGARCLEERRPISRWIDGRLLVAGFLSFTLFWAINPYILLDQEGWRAQFFGNIEKTGAFAAEEGALHGYADYGRKLLDGVGPGVLVLGLLGAAALAFRRGRRATAAILLGFPVVFYLVMGTFDTRNPRYLLPLYPVLCLTAAYLLAAGSERIRGAALLGPVVALAVAAHTLLAGSAVHVSALARVQNIWRTDNRVLATNWVNANLPPGTKILVERNAEYGPTLSPERYVLGRHDLRPGDDVESVADIFDRGFEYVILSSFVYDLNREFETLGFYEDFRREGRLVPVAAFPGKEFNDTFHNPTIRVYRAMASPPALLRDPDGRYEHVSGAMYAFEAAGEREADTETEPRRSAVLLYEDDRPLGPAHEQHERIAKLGGGRYSHWKDGKIYFSTSDGTDPNRNGRVYAFRDFAEAAPAAPSAEF